MLKFHRYFWSLLGVAIGLTYKNISILLLVSGMTGWCTSRVRQVVWRCIAQKHPPRDPVTGMLLAAVFLWGWMLLSAFWSPPGDEVARKLAIALLLIGTTIGALALAATMPQREVGRTHQMIVIGLVIGSGILCLEAFTGSLLRQLVPPAAPRGEDIVATSRGLTIALAFLPGLMLWTIRRSVQTDRAGRYFAALGAAVIYLMMIWLGVRLDVFANVVAIGLLPVFCFPGAIWPRAVTRALGGMAAIAFLFSPFVAAQLDRLYSPLLTAQDMAATTASERQIVSALHRLVIWDFSAEIILDDPVGFLFGEGAHAADDFSARAPQYKARIDTIRQATGLTALPTHPHNLFLEIWLELGLVGVSLVLMFLYHLIKYVDRLLRAETGSHAIGAAIAGMYVLFLLHAAVEMSLWRDWRVSMVSMGVFFMILSARRKTSPAEPERHHTSLRGG